MGALVLRPNPQGLYAQVSSPSKTANKLVHDVTAYVRNEVTKTQAAGVAVNKWMLVAPETIVAGAKDVTDLGVDGPSRSAAVREVCSIPEYGLVKIHFGRTVSQGTQYIPLAERPTQPGESVLAATIHGDAYQTMGGLLLPEGVLSGIDMTSRDIGRQARTAQSDQAVGLIMDTGGTHLNGMLIATQSTRLSEQDLLARNIEFEPAAGTAPTLSSVLDYDATRRIVAATMPGS
jgi:hypothetical protein